MEEIVLKARGTIISLAIVYGKSQVASQDLLANLSAIAGDEVVVITKAGQVVLTEGIKPFYTSGPKWQVPIVYRIVFKKKSNQWGFFFCACLLAWGPVTLFQKGRNYSPSGRFYLVNCAKIG